MYPQSWKSASFSFTNSYAGVFTAAGTGRCLDTMSDLQGMFSIQISKSGFEDYLGQFLKVIARIDACGAFHRITRVRCSAWTQLGCSLADVSSEKIVDFSERYSNLICNKTTA